MAINVEFLFDFGSPNAYLSHLVIPRIEARTGVKFEYVPVLLGGVFKATNNVSPAVSLQGIKNKPQYTQLETRRFLKEHGIKDYAPNVRDATDKIAIIKLLETAMEECESQLREHADEMKNTMKRFDGKQMTKLAFMSFAIAHEMYHRGQLTVYERLLGIEPMLTQRFRKAFGESPP